MKTRRFCYESGVRSFHQNRGTVHALESELQIVTEASQNQTTTPSTSVPGTNREPSHENPNETRQETPATTTTHSGGSKLEWDIAMYRAYNATPYYEPFWELVGDRAQVYCSLRCVMDAMVNAGVNSASMLDPLLRQWHDCNGTSAVYLETGFNGVPIKQENP